MVVHSTLPEVNKNLNIELQLEYAIIITTPIISFMVSGTKDFYYYKMMTDVCQAEGEMAQSGTQVQPKDMTTTSRSDQKLYGNT
jgi:hypothetical protein